MWKDETSYKRGERGTVEPRVWEASSGSLRVTLHRLHGIDGWFVTCHEISLVQRELSATTLPGLKAEAVSCVQVRLAKMMADLLKIKEPSHV